MKVEGMKESEFIMGTKFSMQYMNQYSLHPFIPKSTKIY